MNLKRQYEESLNLVHNGNVAAAIPIIINILKDLDIRLQMLESINAPKTPTYDNGEYERQQRMGF
jgi:hypothetical protein